VPITFVDRAAGESKMSSRIVFEALALVTWWGMGRIVRGLQRDGRQAAHVASGSRAGSNDPVRSA
jgi:ABC-type dipeptide/oligopeptide/nickel transport system permease subunit